MVTFGEIEAPVVDGCFGLFGVVVVGLITSASSFPSLPFAVLSPSPVLTSSAEIVSGRSALTIPFAFLSSLSTFPSPSVRTSIPSLSFLSFPTTIGAADPVSPPLFRQAPLVTRGPSPLLTPEFDAVEEGEDRRDASRCAVAAL